MLETERLLMRKLAPEDLPQLIEQRADPEVYKYLGGIERQNAAALAKRLRFYIECYEKYGFGTCAMIWKETGAMIGTSGLQPLGETEVGYALIKEFWGRGVGYEAARAWLAYGFETLELERIVAVAAPENTASRRIMEKCGMRYEKTETHYDSECVFYAVTKEEFLQFGKSGNIQM